MSRPARAALPLSIVIAATALAALTLQGDAQQPPQEFRIPEDEVPRQRDASGGQVLLPQALEFVRSLAFDAPDAAFDSAFSTREDA